MKAKAYPECAVNPVPCDVLITRNHQIFINGHQIGWVFSITTDSDAARTRLVLEMYPTSLMFGDPPQETIERLHQDGMNLSDPAARVDITKAIKQATARVLSKEVFRGVGEVDEGPAEAD